MRRRFIKVRRSYRYGRRRGQRLLRLLRRHPFTLPIGLFVLLLIASTTAVVVLGGTKNVEASRALIAIVSHDGVQQTVPTDEPTVGALLAKLHVKLNEGDVVEPAATTPIDQDEFRINVYRAIPVEIVDGAHKTFAFSAATTPRSIAAQAGTTIYPEDYLSIVPTTNFIQDGAVGERLVIDRATPVYLNLYGTQLNLRTHARTVADLLKEKGVQLRAGETVQPALTTPVVAGQQIFVLSKGTQLVSSSESIPAPVQTINDSSLSRGTSAVRQAGSAGQELVTYIVNQKDGSRKQIQAVVVVPPVTEIIAQGTAPLSTSLSEWLYQLRMCESHGNYQDNTGNGYYGAYQFSPGTWQSLGYSGLPSDAPPYEQDQAIIRNTLRSGGGLASQNPGCYYRTGIGNFPPQ